MVEARTSLEDGAASKPTSSVATLVEVEFMNWLSPAADQFWGDIGYAIDTPPVELVHRLPQWVEDRKCRRSETNHKRLSRSCARKMC